jgi:primary-amine oxidase
MVTVYNYDYMFDYIFYLEGSIEVLMAASGYLQVGII